VSPSADQVNALEVPDAVSEALLQDGEEIILALKPSGWYVLLISCPVLVAAGVVAVASELFGFAGPRQAVPVLCAVAVCLRLVVACCQWMGVLYLLTNKRVMRVRGLLRADSCWCELRKISQVIVSASTLEGLIGLGSLMFQQENASCQEACWVNIDSPRQVQQAVEGALKRLP